MIIRQVVLMHETPIQKWDALTSYFRERDELVGRGTLPDGRRYINAKFQDELDVCAFMIGAGLWRTTSIRDG